MGALENLASKKLVAASTINGFLLTLAIQQPEKAMACAYLAVGYNAFYSLLEVIDKWVNKGNNNGERKEQAADVKNNNEKPV